MDCDDEAPAADRPPYRRIAADLRRRIRDGRWRPGAPLPSRRDMAREYDVNPNTLGRAIACLQEEGWVRTTPRFGAFVASALPSDAPPEEPTPPPVHDGRPPVVGLLSWRRPEDAETEWVPMACRALERMFSVRGMVTRPFRLDSEHPAAMRATVNAALASGVDALAATWFRDVDAWLDPLAETHLSGRVPVFILRTQNIPYPIPHTYIDERGSGYVAVDHLLRAGYRDLYFLSPFRPEPVDWAARRLAGADFARRRGGVAGSGQLTRLVPEHPCTWSEWERIGPTEKGYRLVRNLLAPILSARRPRTRTPAVVAANDIVAGYVRRVAMESGWRPGVDIGLVGFDDQPLSGEWELTSFRNPFPEMAREAARVLSETLAGRTPPSQIPFNSQLILRASTCRAAAPTSTSRVIVERV